MRTLASLTGAVALCLVLTLGLNAHPAAARGRLSCAGPRDFRPAARHNAASLTTLHWSPFRTPETGWETYLPLIAHEIGSPCPPASPRFAASLARWQALYPLPVTGVMDPQTFEVMKGVWQERRPFVMAMVAKTCPAPPPETSLVTAGPDDALPDKPVSLRPGALNALHRMIAAARRALPELADQPDVLRAFSGYRSPAYDDDRCLKQQNCQGVTRAQCSAHRTGLAVDLYLGAAEGFTADSADPTNRLYQSRTPAYRWLVAHAARYGFVNYPFEPWHWEWTGEPVAGAAARGE